jgi:hypothetical protein
MANGAAVALLPSAAPTSAAAGKPIETEIGAATASAVTGLCFAVAESQNGGLRSATRTENGERIAKMFELQEATLGKLDFAATAREQGKIVLRQYLGDDFYRQYSLEQGDAAIDMFIDETLAVLRKVTATMRAWAH